jgi:hypothetical protein
MGPALRLQCEAAMQMSLVVTGQAAAADWCTVCAQPTTVQRGGALGALGRVDSRSPG